MSSYVDLTGLNHKEQQASVLPSSPSGGQDQSQPGEYATPTQVKRIVELGKVFYPDAKVREGKFAVAVREFSKRDIQLLDQLLESEADRFIKELERRIHTVPA